MRTTVIAPLLAASFLAIPALADDPVSHLRSLYPGAKVLHMRPQGPVMVTAGGVASGGGEEGSLERQRLTYIFGADMTSGLTEAQAAETFLAQHGELFGGRFQGVGVGQAEGGQGNAGPGEQQPEARQLWAITAKNNRFTSFAYTQYIRGKEVVGSTIRVKVRRGQVPGEIPRVDYAAARVAGEPTAGSETPILTAEAASLFVRLASGIAGLTIQGTPELVVLRGDIDRPDAWCWRVRTQSGEGAAASCLTFFVDSSAPRVLHTESDWSHANESRDPPTTGTVEAYGTSAVYPYLPYQPGVSSLSLHRIPFLRVTATVSPPSAHPAPAYTNGDGEFAFASTIDLTAVSATFTATADPGTWYYHFQGDVVSATQPCLPGSHVQLVLDNASMSEEFRVAQVNAIINAQRAKGFFTSHISDSLVGLTFPMELVPNQPASSPSECGGLGFYHAYDVYYMRLGASWGTSTLGMYSCASPSIITHEYGHRAHRMLGLYDGVHAAWREGYSDSYAQVVLDDNVMGREQYKNGTAIRNDPTLDTVDCQWPLADPANGPPCDCSVPHLAGQLLSGVWGHLRQEFKNEYGAVSGLLGARVVFGNWSLITIGTDNCNSASTATLLEVLSAVSNDDVPLVCNAFAEHSIFPVCDCFLCP